MSDEHKLNNESTFDVVPNEEEDHAIQVESNEDLDTIPQEQPASDEHYRLAGRPPLKTMLILCFGPTISMISSTLYGIVDTLWVSKALGTSGVSKISTYSSFDSLGRAFGMFLQVAASSRISALYGQKRGDEAAQVMVDLLRCSLVLGAFVPAAILPWVKNAARWFGASEEIVEDGFSYISTTLGGSVVSCLYMCVSGCLQGEGRTLFLGIAHVTSTVLNMALFDPLLIITANLGVRGAGLATVLSEFLPMSLFMVMYFMGKFTTKPSLGMLIKPFDSRTIPALGVGLSQLVSSLSVNVPAILILYYTGSATTTPEDYTAALAGLNVTFRFSALTIAICFAFNAGYLPAASYAAGRGNTERWKWLTIHLTWLNFAWGSITSTIYLIFAKQIVMMFDTGERFLYYAVPLLRYGTGGYYIIFIRFTSQLILQSLQLGMRATVLNFTTQFLILIVASFILYKVFPHDPTIYQLTYPITFLLGGIISIFFVIKPLKEFMSSTPDIEEEKGIELEDNSVIEV